MNRFDTTAAGLRQIIDNGESPTVEFKTRPLPDGVTAALIAAFANGDGGLLIVGVQDNGKVVGLRPDEAREAAGRIRSIGFNLLGDPIEGGVADIDGSPVVYAVIPQAPVHRRPVITGTGDPYVRRGEATISGRQMSTIPEELSTWDVFISHASEDKDVVARPLADELRRRGLRVWYDEFSLSLGDSLRRSIDRGLTHSRFGVVVLSRDFFRKEWPQRELDGLTSREVAGRKVILPVWHEVSHSDVAQFSPTLADRLAIQTASGIRAIADAIQKQVNQRVTDLSADANPGSPTRPPLRPRNIALEGLPVWEDNTSTTLFGDRMADAFPGVRELRWFDAKEAIQRLDILLQSPLAFRTATGGIIDPIWWFRGLRNSSINEFECLDPPKCLMNHEELLINRIAAFRTDAYYQQFVYVETMGEQPVGLYPYQDGYIEECLAEFGYAREEYALFGERPITRAELDDGSAVLDGAIVRTRGAKLRSRYLSPYNFIIAAKFSPYNSTRFDGVAQTFLDRILAGEAQLQDLLGVMTRLPRHRNDGEPVT